ncbi:MAG: DUF488 domain-containing protein [Nitrospirota bacterium]
MVVVKRIYDPLSRTDGKRILVDRLWPRGIRKDEARIDAWLKDIAPSTELRKSFGHDPDKWPLFKTRYKQELKEHGELVDELRRTAKKGRVTLLFSAKDREHNNAVVLKEVLERGGTEK